MYPSNADSTDTNGGQKRRNEGDTKAAQIAAHHFVEHTERVGGEHHQQPCITDGYNLRIIVENRQKILSGEQHQRDCGCRSDQVFDQAQKQGSFAASDLPCAKVLPDKGRAGLAERVQHIIGENFNVVCRTGRCHDHRAKAVDGRLDYDVGNRKHGTLNPGRQTDFHDLPEGCPIDPQRLPLYMNVLLGNPQTPEQQHRADRIGDHRGDGNTVDGHVQDSHKKQVQRYIQDTGDEQCNQRDFCLAHTAENCRLKVIKQNHGHSQQVDSQVEQRRTKHIVRHMERVQQRSRREFTDYSHKNAAQKRYHNRGMDRFFHRLPVIPSDGVGDDNIRTQRNADEQVDDQGDNRAVCPHRRHSYGLSRTGEVTYHYNVGGIE